MTWATFDVWGDDEANGPEQVHVIPTYEEHDVSGDCWCRPREDDGVFVHRDKLDRDPPAPPVSDERLREALRTMIDVYDRHDRWCGHYAQAPGDGIIHRIDGARNALAAADREKPDEDQT
jgi:hypothetical protein